MTYYCILISFNMYILFVRVLSFYLLDMSERKLPVQACTCAWKRISYLASFNLTAPGIPVTTRGGCESGQKRIHGMSPPQYVDLVKFVIIQTSIMSPLNLPPPFLFRVYFCLPLSRSSCYFDLINQFTL